MSDTQSWLHVSARRLDLYTRYSLYLGQGAPISIIFFMVVQNPLVASWVIWTVSIIMFLMLAGGMFAIFRAMQVLEHGPSDRTRIEILVWLAVGAAATVTVGLLAGPGYALAPGLVTLQPLVLSMTFRGMTLLSFAATVAALSLTPLIGPPAAIASAVIIALVLGTFWVAGWSLKVIWALDAARRTAARLAIAEERLRFSRDLHDVFGRTLSSVAVKAELGAGLAEHGRAAEAAVQMREVHQLAEDAGREVRAVVQGYREVDLSQELIGARSVLSAAGVDCVITAAPDDVGSAASAALGWVVREGVTNVLRHSTSSHVTIDLTKADDDWVLAITNDGVQTSPHGSGSGLIGLEERLHQVAGTLHTEAIGETFRLRADVPSGPTQPTGTSRIRSFL